MSKIDKEIIEEINTAVENTEKKVRMRQILGVAEAYTHLKKAKEDYIKLIERYDEDLVETAEGLSEEQIRELRINEFREISNVGMASISQYYGSGTIIMQK